MKYYVLVNRNNSWRSRSSYTSLSSATKAMNMLARNGDMNDAAVVELNIDDGTVVKQVIQGKFVSHKPFGYSYEKPKYKKINTKLKNYILYNNTITHLSNIEAKEELENI